MSRKLKFPNSRHQTQSGLDTFAKNILYRICEDKDLTLAADELELKVYSARSEHTGWFSNLVNTFQAEVLLESDKWEAYCAPFSAGLAEIRTVAKMNLIVLLVVEDSKDGKAAAKLNYESLKKDLTGTRQYFTSSALRLAALEDFFVARGFIDPLDDRTQESPSISSSPRPFFSVVRWGEEDIPCSQVTEVNDDTDMIGLFKSMSLFKKSRDCSDVKWCISVLEDHIENERMRNALSAGEDSPPIRDCPIVCELLDRFRCLDGRVRTNAMCRDFLTLKYLPVYEEAFNCAFLPCKKLPGRYCLFDDGTVPRTSTVNVGFALVEDRVTSVFVINVPASADCANLAILYEGAQAALTSAQRDTADLHLWWDVYMKSQKYLNTVSSHWLPIWEAGKLRLPTYNDVKYVSSLMSGGRVVTPETITSFCAIIESLANMGKFDLGINIAMRIAGRIAYATPDYWYWRTVLFRKGLQYNEALFSIHQALKSGSGGRNTRMLHLANQEKDFIVWLERNEVRLPTMSYLTEEYKYSDSLDYFADELVRSDATEFYDVLSIDGGGVRGIIPALILAEVERRAGIPLYRLFHLNIGTSTGSLIAAALLLPRGHCDRPLTAGEITRMYVGDTIGRVFERTWHIYGFLGPKYTNGRVKVFGDIFGPTTVMSTCLSDLAIVAAEPTPVRARVFCKRSDPRTCVVDALTASSAAPTFFSSHMIGGKEYVDGVIVANNPGIEGYREAI